MNRERGASALLVAVCTFLLLGMAAIAVDAAMGMSQRRQVQSAADFASLAALQFATSCGTGPCTPAASANAGAAEAMAVVADNLPDYAASINWATCTDPGRPAAYTRVASTTPCVSFTANFERARVRVPDTNVPTFFARVIGFTSIRVAANAEAEQKTAATGGIVPFAFGSGTSTCLYSNQASQTVPPCDGPSDGNFGYLDVTLYGNTVMGTTADCTGAPLSRMVINIKLGSDHNMAPWTSGDPVVNDHAACPNRSETVNELEVKTGSPSGAITQGLVTTAGARLRCGSAPSCRSVRGTSLNDTPLWRYLIAGKCPAVDSATTDADKHAKMIACLQNPPAGVIFAESIGSSSRLVAVPDFFTYPTNGASAAYKIENIVPVFLDTIYADCNANTCNTVFTPGVTSSGACPGTLAATDLSCGFNPGTWNGKQVEGLTALTLDLQMLPESVRNVFPGQPGARTLSLYR